MKSLIIIVLGLGLSYYFTDVRSESGANIVLAMTAAYGAMAYTLYSIAVAHANDHARPEDFVKVSGGLLLLFADPLLTGESRYAIGDRRRPQDVALLSPILAHWGLELRFAEQPDAAPQLRALGDLALPVEQPGQLALIDKWPGIVREELAG